MADFVAAVIRAVACSDWSPGQYRLCFKGLSYDVQGVAAMSILPGFTELVSSGAGVAAARIEVANSAVRANR